MDQDDIDCGGSSAQAAARGLGNRPFVSLAEALTWIAFGDAMTADELRAQVEGHKRQLRYRPRDRLRRPDQDARFKAYSGMLRSNPTFLDNPGLGYFEDRQSGLDKLLEAWRQLCDEVTRGTCKVWGRYTATYSFSDASLADVKNLTWDVLAAFSQFDISTGGIRRDAEGDKSILWQGHPDSYSRELNAFGDDSRDREGYLLVEVEQDGLLGAFPADKVIDKPNIATTSTAGAVIAKPRLSDADLNRWWKHLGKDIQQQSIDRVLLPLCKEAHSEHTISRDRVRALAPGRKRGPKPLRHKISAQLPRK